MRTNRKTEQKKMSMNKNIARLAVTAGLTAALSFGGVMAPVTMAFAEGGSIVTFEDSTYATSTTYKGIQIFKANVTTVNGTTTVSGIDWASPEIKTAVVAAIQEKNSAYSSEIAQDAAEWLKANSEVSGTDSKVANDNVLSLIAANLKGSNAWKKTAKGSASLSDLDAGYWLFLTDTAGKPDGKSTDAFTSPVYAVIDGTNAMNIKPKKSVPTVEKKILDDNKVKDDLTSVLSGDWDDVADSQIGQVVNYKLTGTIASNYATFDTYAYKFTDELSGGLDYVDGSVEVYALNGSTYTPIDNSNYSVTNANASNNNTLTVEFKVDETDKGLKDVAGVDANTQIVVFYKAKLNKNAIIGNNIAENTVGGNPNTAKLEYSNNPYGEGRGETIEDTVADFAFKLNLNKVDQGTEKGLEGAVFTIQSADANTNDQYVASKDDETKDIVAGQLVTVEGSGLPEYVKFTSDASGKIAVSGLDAGFYKVTEVQAPNNSYTVAQPFTFSITPKYNSNGTKIESLKAEFTETRSDIAFGELDNTAGDNKLTGKNNTGTNPTTGEVTINVGNTKSVGLPLTGLNGVTFTWIAGGAVLCIGVAHLIRSRKQAEESEQE